MIEVTKQLLEKIAKQPRGKRDAYLSLLSTQEWERCADDPLYWLDASQHAIPYVYTLDPRPLYLCKTCGDGVSHPFDKLEYHVAESHGVQDASAQLIRSTFSELPTKRSFTILPYMPPIIDVWLKRKLLAIEKSRDMMATWLVCALYTWDTIFHPGRENIFQSETGLKASELVERSYFIASNMPKFLRKRCSVEYAVGQSRSGVLLVNGGKNRGGSEILGFPQGPDQVRMFHPAGIFLDEAAFQMEASEAFKAVKPAIQAGGRVTMLSSANPGFFQAICRDKLEQYGI